MKDLKIKIKKFLDCYIWPFFINGQKQEEYFEKLRKKYKVNEDGSPNTEN